MPSNERDLMREIATLKLEVAKLDRERKWHAVAIVGSLICIGLLALAGAANAGA